MPHRIVAAIQRVAMTPFALVCSCGEVIMPPEGAGLEPRKQYEAVSASAVSHVDQHDRVWRETDGRRW